MVLKLYKRVLRQGRRSLSPKKDSIKSQAHSSIKSRRSLSSLLSSSRAAPIPSEINVSVSSPPDPETAEPIQEPTLLERIGGRDVLQSIVQKFVALVAADETLVGFFEGVDLKILSLHQKRFLPMAFTKIPEGVSIESSIRGHHQHLFQRGLNESHFDSVAVHLVEAMKAHVLMESQINEAVGIVAPLRDIFERGAREEEEKQTGSASSTN